MLSTLLTALALSATPTPTPAPAPPACTSAEHRQFDFWVGDWRVSKPDGTFAGINRITLEYGGCVVHEHYVTGKGYSGESLNIYDATRKVWHQSWVDNGGLFLAIEGKWNGKAMVLEGEGIQPDGSKQKQRVTWTPNDKGGLRQLWESANAKGEWTVVFDGIYTKT